MIVCSLQEVTTCTEGPHCRPSVTRTRKMRLKWSCASARTLSMERALQSFSRHPTCRPPTMTTHSVGMERGLQARLASVCHTFSGSSSVVFFLRAHQKAAHKRGIFFFFGHLESVVWPFSRVPSGRACGRLESDRIITGFSGRLRHGELPVQTTVPSDAVA